MNVIVEDLKVSQGLGRKEERGLRVVIVSEGENTGRDAKKEVI